MCVSGGDHEGLPSRERGRHVQQLSGGRRAVGCHGVSGGRGAHRHRDPHQVGQLEYRKKLHKKQQRWTWK